MLRIAILVYLVLSAVFLIRHPAHIVKDIVVAPLLLLVPLGLGLAIRRVCLGHVIDGHDMSRLQVLLFSLFIGMTAQTILYQQLERIDVLRDIYSLLYPAAFIVALYGLYKEESLFDIASSDRRQSAGWILFHTPLIALTYAFYFLKFTQYPLRDIFQETHFMKGATELARFHILNPFTADSYIPVLQVHLGLLHDWYGYDLLASQWILPILFAVVRYLSLVCLFQALSQSPLTRLIATALAIVTLQNLFSVTNGDMVFSVCLLLISVMLREREISPTRGWACLSAGGLFVAAILLYKISTVQSIGLYWVVLVTALVLYRMTSHDPAVSKESALLLCVTAVALHPAVALLYLFCSLSIVCFYNVIMSGWEHQSTSVRWRVVLILAMATGAMGIVFLNLSRSVFSDRVSPPLFHGIAEWILGKEITGGEGIRNTTIEWVRLAPPALILLLGLLALSQAAHSLRALGDRRAGWFNVWKRSLAEMSATTVLAWSSCLVGLFISFSGLPYFHRALYFPLLMGCLLTAILLCAEIARYQKEGGKGILLKYSLLMLFYIGAAGRYAYQAPDFGGRSPIPYVQALSPYLAVALSGLSYLFVAACMTKIPWRLTVLSLSIVVIGVMSDKFAIKSYGYRYSYGDAWPKDRPISHYTIGEIQLASRIRSLPMNTILLSDPYTLSIVEALTGLNGLYSFSNLDVMRQDYKYNIQGVLSSFKEPGKSGQCGEGEAVARRVMHFIELYPGAVPEVRYVWERKIAKPFGVRMLQENLVVILNAGRTFPWTDGRDSYFPTPDRFDDDFIEFQIAKCFEIMENIDNTVLALRLK